LTDAVPLPSASPGPGISASPFSRVMNLVQAPSPELEDSAPLPALSSVPPYTSSP
jgi:hypothetical protein